MGSGSRGLTGQGESYVNRHRKAPTVRHGSRLGLLAAFVLAASLLLGAALADAVAPVVTIEPATAVQYTTAHVEGKVNPEGHETNYHFEYVSQAKFAATEWAEASGAGFNSLPETTTTATPVSENLSGLNPETVYHIRLVAENTEGEQAEAIAGATFETEAVTKPTVTIAPVSGSPVTTAHFSGTVNPSAPSGALDEATANAYRTSWHFECVAPGLSCNGSLSGAIEADPTSHEFPTGAVTVEGEATGLQPNTTYHVKLVASNAGGSQAAGETGGGPVEFTTPAVAPVVTPVGNTPLGARAVGLGAYVTPGNSHITDCQFEYGTTTAYGQSHPCSGHPGNEVQLLRVSATSGQFKLNFGGQTTPDISFNAPAPTVQAELGALASIGSSNVAVTGGPGDLEGSAPYRIEFVGSLADKDIAQIASEPGTEPLGPEHLDSEGNPFFAGAASVTTDAPGGLGDIILVRAQLAGLTPGAAYHARLSVTTQAGGTVTSKDDIAPVPIEEGSSCPNAGALGVGFLPDCRAWEMASAPGKNGANVISDPNRVISASAGNTVNYEALGAFGDAVGTDVATEYIARRSQDPDPGNSGWTTHAITPDQPPIAV